MRRSADYGRVLSGYSRQAANAQSQPGATRAGVKGRTKRRHAGARFIDAGPGRAAPVRRFTIWSQLAVVRFGNAVSSEAISFNACRIVGLGDDEVVEPLTSACFRS